MPRPLQVYGWNDFKGGKQIRLIVAAPSFAAASRAAVAAGFFKIHKDYCSTTGNSAELEAALGQPGVILGRGLDDYHGPYEPFPAREEPTSGQ